MNDRSAEALARYRQLKNGTSAIKELIEELEMLAWNQFMDALDDDEEEDQEDHDEECPRNGRYCF